ncbi:MAG TPA: GAF domain-containing sensor histidine kinase, partial [Actinomycetota bacterium]|nr:GAF domain-containing sensor histidine kinase [Actinomycetota bacterium]
MISVGRSTGRAAPNPLELLSIEERARYLFALRVVLVAAAVVFALSDRAQLVVSPSAVAAGATVYLALAAAPHLLHRRAADLLLPVIRGMLLVDGLAVAGVVAVSGGATSHARFLALGHVVAVTLLVSYRTGLKIAMWHTLLFLLVALAEPAGLLGTGRPYALLEATTTMTVLGLWLAALGTATFAALSERELRRQKIDLEHLSEMLAGIQAADGVEEIARIFLAEAIDTFGFRRGAVVASATGDLRVLAASGDTGGDPVPIEREPVVGRALAGRTALALRTLDPGSDPGLARLLPDASDVLVVPLRGDRGRGVGVALLERGEARRGMRRWVVAMVEQFAWHTGLALDNAWLSEEREARIREIQELQGRLERYNADLEATVAERTGELRTAISHLEEVDRQRRRLLEHVVRVGEEERTRIAGDIHDDPVQKLVALKMRLELLGRAHPELEGIAEAKDGVLVSIRSLRHLLFDLRPPVLDEQGLAPALRSFLENAEVDFDWSVEDELPTQPSAQTRLILYRIAQEALTNTRKHADAEHVRVRLTESESGVAMEIADDGVGFEPLAALVAAPGHLGLAAMRERAEMAGGRCELHSLPGQGTTLDVWMPLTQDRPTVDPAEAGGRD